MTGDGMSVTWVSHCIAGGQSTLTPITVRPVVDGDGTVQSNFRTEGIGGAIGLKPNMAWLGGGVASPRSGPITAEYEYRNESR